MYKLTVKIEDTLNSKIFVTKEEAVNTILKVISFYGINFDYKIEKIN